MSAVAIGLLAAGLGLLRWSWLRRRRGRVKSAVLAGWLAIAASFMLFAQGFGGERGIAFALLAFSLGGLIGVMATVEVRARRFNSRDRAAEPARRAANWPRAVAKSLLAIVLAGAASIGLGVAFAVAMPMAAVDRMVVGGLMVPVLWGGAMAWTMADSRLGRAAVILLAICAAGYAVAFLPGLHD